MANESAVITVSDGQVRYWARKAGYRVAKARGRQHMNNHGGYQVLDDHNNVVAGSNFDVSADEVMDIVSDDIILTDRP